MTPIPSTSVPSISAVTEASRLLPLEALGLGPELGAGAKHEREALGGAAEETLHLLVRDRDFAAIYQSIHGVSSFVAAFSPHR
jgi:hypothetical protein